MKELLRLQGRYNQEANKKMIAVLEGLDENVLTKDMGLYYKSILGTMVHYSAGDASFLRIIFHHFVPKLLVAQRLRQCLQSHLLSSRKSSMIQAISLPQERC